MGHEELLAQEIFQSYVDRKFLERVEWSEIDFGVEALVEAIGQFLHICENAELFCEIGRVAFVKDGKLGNHGGRRLVNDG